MAAAALDLPKNAPPPERPAAIVPIDKNRKYCILQKQSQTP